MLLVLLVISFFGRRFYITLLTFDVYCKNKIFKITQIIAIITYICIFYKKWLWLYSTFFSGLKIPFTTYLLYAIPIFWKEYIIKIINSKLDFFLRDTHTHLQLYL